MARQKIPLLEPTPLLGARVKLGRQAQMSFDLVRRIIDNGTEALRHPTRFIVLHRTDPVRLSIGLMRKRRLPAVQATDEHAGRGAGFGNAYEGRRTPPVYLGVEEYTHTLLYVLQAQKMLQDFDTALRARGFPVLSIAYEHDLVTPDRWNDTVRCVLDFLQPQSAPHSTVHVQRDPSWPIKNTNEAFDADVLNAGELRERTEALQAAFSMHVPLKWPK